MRTYQQYPTKSMPTLFKYPGAKSGLAKAILSYFPPLEEFNHYVEPFLGSGAIFLRTVQLLPTIPRYTLADVDFDVVNTFRAIQAYPQEVFRLLCQMPVDKEFYYKIRDLDRQEDFSNLPSAFRAARHLYLLSNCYNGLMRRNRSGQYNSPFGTNNINFACRKKKYLKISGLLSKAEILQGDFEKVIRKAINDPKTTFLYLDPPYLAANGTEFVEYSSKFEREEQQRLKEVVDALTEQGVKVLLSNSFCSAIDDLYPSDRYFKVVLKSKRNVNRYVERRGWVPEYLIRNYFDTIVSTNC